MTSLLFVHGVATRAGLDYDKAVAARNRRFAESTFKAPIDVFNPYWGRYGADPRWNLACIPDVRGKAVALNLGGTVGGIGAATIAGSPVLEAARADFKATIASLAVEDLDRAEQTGDEGDIRRTEAFWRGAGAYAERSAKPVWLEAVSNDTAFAAELEKQVAPLVPEVTLGLLGVVKGAASRLAGAISNTVNTPFARIGRDAVSPTVAVFVGDVFRYLKDGPARGLIRQVVLNDMAAAALAAGDGGTLVVVGHSMGGVILYDLLSDHDAIRELGERIGFEFKPSLLITVGSQVALFEELKVFASSDEAIPVPGGSEKTKVAKPVCVLDWWNVWDRMDVLSFLAEPVFDGATDLAADTIAGVKDAHSAYFSSMPFYERLHIRMKEANIIR
ncbi:hypothetical protein [uncultured Sphingomonas sp.]|uniref:hypothetical protein n=1 Tax=uncultured Sphingomonas sp. TaxID=158754 RepID=UPI00374908F7